MWQRLRVLRVKYQKVSLKRWPGAYTCGGGGLSSHPTPVTWYGNGLSTQHSWWVIRPTQHAAANFIFHRRICSTQYFATLFWDWGKWQIARIDSRQYTYILLHRHIQQATRAPLTPLPVASLRELAIFGTECQSFLPERTSTGSVLAPAAFRSSQCWRGSRRAWPCPWTSSRWSGRGHQMDHRQLF